MAPLAGDEVWWKEEIRALCNDVNFKKEDGVGIWHNRENVAWGDGILRCRVWVQILAILSAHVVLSHGGTCVPVTYMEDQDEFQAPGFVSIELQLFISLSFTFSTSKISINS